MHRKLLFLILLLHITAWFVLKPVWPFSDDYCYAYHAYSIGTPDFHHTDNVFQNRFGVIIPVSGLFYLFGINPYTIALWPLIASLLTIVIIFSFVSKIADERVALISCFLLSVNTLQITYSIALFPDIFIELYSIACVLLVYYGREIKHNKKIFPFLFVFWLFLGVLTKETIVLVFPFILLTLFFDIYRKQHYTFWKDSFLVGIFLLAIYFVACYFLTGDAFYKFRSTINYNDTGLYSPQIKNAFRLSGSGNFFEWLNSELGLLFILLFSVAILFTSKKLNFSNFEVFISTYSFLLFIILVVLFHTDKYGVLITMDRVWMLCIAPLSIVAAHTLDKAENKIYYFLLISFAVLAVYNYYAVSFNRTVLIGLFLLATVCSFYLKEKNKNWNLLLLIPYLMLAVNFVYSNSNYSVPALRSSSLIKEQLEQLNGSGTKTILTDAEFSENHIIYNGFREYPNLHFYSFSKYDSLQQESGLFVIVNMEKTEVPEFISKDPDNWEKEFDSKKLLIYKKRNN